MKALHRGPDRYMRRGRLHYKATLAERIRNVDKNKFDGCLQPMGSQFRSIALPLGVWLTAVAHFGHCSPLSFSRHLYGVSSHQCHHAPTPEDTPSFLPTSQIAVVAHVRSNTCTNMMPSSMHARIILSGERALRVALMLTFPP
ncbi:uncharacterized protein K489DRAFT_75233 [Dissoconium aciculare CBS 342.82]|uniref:Uncharacterized protein n=1 Tax=Dissoconium aciculare CBS 342.82 TaxID=1314786 RepID=A0A6J3LU23_9PEZI|nr:uncharacterized protein K489DRAFT_75233 [Dissoconium aciculare CBS 342.82]KAF1819133.1 hypothetical protein K489DRAFT_75233 [Dissoconium aciculare CBS 342.82]